MQEIAVQQPVEDMVGAAVEHGMPLPIVDGYGLGVGPFPVIPIAPVGAGLSPGDASSVAPMGIPAGATGEPGAMPSGEVAPIPGVGLPIPPTCANAGEQPKNAACIAAINARRIMISIVRRSGRLVNKNIDPRQ